MTDTGDFSTEKIGTTTSEELIGTYDRKGAEHLPFIHSTLRPKYGHQRLKQN